MENWKPTIDFWQQATAYIENIMRALEVGLPIDALIIEKIQIAKSEALDALKTAACDERAEMNHFIGLIESTEDLLRAQGYTR
jgi:hypothetical protein